MRYQGSKARIANDIIPIITEHMTNGMWYIEPFVGGCNVFDKIPQETKMGIDNNDYVISMWNAIKAGKRPPVDISKEMYDEMRKLASEGKYSDMFPKWLIGYVGNACSYGSSWFNGYAKINEKRGENHIVEAYNNLLKQLDKFKYLESSVFVTGDYRKITDFSGKAVIYCDPPYAETKGYQHEHFNHAEFWEWVRHMSANKGHYVYVSEYNAPDDFKCIWQKNVKDGMGTVYEGGKQNDKIEKLFIYGK